MLIHDYIKRIDIGHPQLQIYYKKTMVHMIWTEPTKLLLTKIKDDEYINFRYFKDSNHKDYKLGTRIYNKNKSFIKLEELLSWNTFFMSMELFRFLLKYAMSYSKNESSIASINIICRAYFIDIFFLKKYY